jgi:hypothetical protein
MISGCGGNETQDVSDNGTDTKKEKENKTTEENTTVENIDEYFYKVDITDDIFNRINGISFKENDIIKREDLCLVKIKHYNFLGQAMDGELIVNQDISEDIIYIFKELYKAKYPLEKVSLVDNYNAEDELSMEDNNTSAFNFRYIFGTNTLSKHSYGRAIDINPKYNPCISIRDGVSTIEPVNGIMDTEYMIKKNDLCYNLFISRGFEWGGDWENPKDYQHFEKK